MIESLRNGGWSIYYAPKVFRNDKEIVLEAVRNHGWDLNYASEELKNNKEFILETIKIKGWVLMYASEELKNNKKLILIALKKICFVDFIKLKKNNNKICLSVKFDRMLLKKSFQKILKLL